MRRAYSGSVSVSIVVTAALWVVAVAAAVWILVPAIAFAFRIGGVRTAILPEVGPPAVVGGDPVYGPPWSELVALGFREVGRTVESARFPFPTHWRWQQFETTHWLVSPDGHTYATLYRLVPDEPVRMSCLTLFDDGTIFRTSCPGVMGTIQQFAKYRRLDVRGRTAGELVGEHRRQLDTFAQDHEVNPRAVTLTDIIAATNAVEWPLMRKMAASSFGIVATFVPAVILVLPLSRGQMSSRELALGVCILAGCYATVRWLIHGPILRQNADRTHTGEPPGRPDDVAEDGTILATGRNERRLRILAVAAALLSSAWLVALLSKLPSVAWREGAVGIVFQLALIAAAALAILRLIGRARGRLVVVARDRRNPREGWLLLGVFNLVLVGHLDWSKGVLHQVLYVVAGLSAILAVAGWQLEKKRGK